MKVMKGRICSASNGCHGCLKKSLATIQVQKDFFRPVTFATSRPEPFARRVAAAFRLRFSWRFSVSDAAAWHFSVAHFIAGGFLLALLTPILKLSPGFHRFGRVDRSGILQFSFPYALAGLVFSQCHFVT